MLYIEANSRDAAFHFSVEAYVMAHFQHDEPVMLIWRTEPCVMLGCNQIAEVEIDLEYARREDIRLVRRSSGGGAIFTDAGTLLISVILPFAEGQNPQHFARETIAGAIVAALERMGVAAKMEGRNDILVGGKKVSGLAQYVCGGRICSHGSLLYDADLDMLERVLRADDGKIRSKALRSVRGRVTNIKEHMGEPCSASEFWKLLKQQLFSGQNVREYLLTEQDIAGIEAIRQKQYGNPVWTFGRTPRFSFHNARRFAGGKVEVYLEVVEGTVAACSINGDFLSIVPVSGLEERLIGKAFQRHAFEAALEGVLLQPYLGSITKEEFLASIFG